MRRKLARVAQWGRNIIVEASNDSSYAKPVALHYIYLKL